MKIISAQQIKQKAHELHEQRKQWHFHILTPQCLLNDSGKFAFVLENSTNNKIYVSYGDQPEMKLGKELVQLLHGEKITEVTNHDETISSEAQKIINRANELNNAGLHWHHHMLFPDCIYNTDKGKWSIIFEDPETKEIIKILSDQEPKSDLQQIENIYYKQKELK